MSAVEPPSPALEPASAPPAPPAEGLAWWWPRIRLAAGAVTATTGLGLGALMLSEGHTHVGAVFLAAGGFRAAWIAREQFAWD